MAALANVALTDTFDTWQLRINQLVVKSNENEGSVEQGFARANDANSIARSGFAQANTARSHANVAFEGANTARGHANAAFLQANTGRDQANLAFTRANLANQISVGNTLSSVFTLRSSARTRLNFIPSGSVTINVEDDSAGDRVNVTFGVGTADTTSPFIRANIAHSHANAAFEQANTARDRGNSAFTQATDAYTRANTSSVAFPQANTARDHANAAFAAANTKVTGTSPSSQGTYTNVSWSTVMKIDQGFAFEWLKGAGLHSWGLGVTANSGFYLFNSTADDNIAAPNYFFRVSGNVFTYNAQTIWHAGNDGSGSGLDADTVDGVHASSLVATSDYTAADVLTKIKTVDGAGSGLDADLLDGLNAASTATASTIAARDGNGYLFGVYLNSTDNSQASGVTGVMVKASDNYLRTGTAAAVASFLSGQTMNISGTSTNITAYTINQSVGSSNNVQFNSLGVGTAGSGTAGEIRATNNITAYYSDMRLKDIEGTIPNAMDLIMQLSGVFFRSNKLAGEYGYTDDSRQVGVIAQEVQKVLPEAVAPAPFDTEFDENGVMSSISGENYLTVRMERLIPLLIEGMKAQQLQIQALQAEIAKLKG